MRFIKGRCTLHCCMLSCPAPEHGAPTPPAAALAAVQAGQRGWVSYMHSVMREADKATPCRHPPATRRQHQPETFLLLALPIPHCSCQPLPQEPHVAMETIHLLHCVMRWGTGSRAGAVQTERASRREQRRRQSGESKSECQV